MTTAIAPITHSDPARADVDTRSHRSLLTVGLATGAAAVAANMIICAAALGLDVSLKVGGFGAAKPAPIPVAGFASMTLLGAVVGLLMAAGAARWAQKPARLFVTMSAVATTLSLLAPAAGAADAGTLVVLLVTHLTAAAIVVTALARRLEARSRH